MFCCCGDQNDVDNMKSLTKTPGMDPETIGNGQAMMECTLDMPERDRKRYKSISSDDDEFNPVDLADLILLSTGEMEFSTYRYAYASKKGQPQEQISPTLKEQEGDQL